MNPAKSYPAAFLFVLSLAWAVDQPLSADEGELSSRSVRLDLQILRLNPADSNRHLVALPGGEPLEIGAAKVIPTIESEALVGDLIRRNEATLLSEPRIITTPGRSAKIEIARMPDRIPAPDAAKQMPSIMRVSIECLLRVTDDPDQMNLHIDFTTTPADEKRSERKLETNVAVVEGSAVVTRGPTASTILVVTPKWSDEPSSTPVKHGRDRLPPRLPAAEPDCSGILGELIQIKSEIETIDDGSAIEIELNREHFEIKIITEDESRLAEFAKTLSAHASLEVESTRFETLGRGAMLQVVGHRVTGSPRGSVNELRRLRREMASLKAAIEELVQLRLNRSSQ